MANDWASCRWGDLATLEYGKSLRDYSDAIGPYIVYGTNGPIGKHSEPLCNHAGVIIGRKGAYRGVHYSGKPFFVIDTAFYLEPKVEIDPKWAYYQILTYDINAMDSGSAIPSTSRGDFYRLPVEVPPLLEQRAIAHILGTLDDKIELNRRMNETLEALARAIFKAWFVDFDPVRAKMEGRQPAGMDAETAALFPAEFEDSALGQIPKGWKVGLLSEIAAVVMGASPSGETYNDAGIGTPLINGPVEFGEYFAAKSKWTTSPTRLSNIGDLIFCVRGSTTGRRVIADDVYCLGRGVCAIRSRHDCQPFVYQVVNFGLDRLLARTSGSVFPNLSGADISQFEILIPPQELMRDYCLLTEILTKRVWQNVKESETLAVLRATLLPKLLSGEVRVR